MTYNIQLLQRLSLLISWFLYPIPQQSSKISFNVGVVTFQVREKPWSLQVITHPLTGNNRDISSSPMAHISNCVCIHIFLKFSPYISTKAPKRISTLLGLTAKIKTKNCSYVTKQEKMVLEMKIYNNLY